MDWSSIGQVAILGGVLGAVGGGVGALLSRLFPKRARPAVIAVAVALAVGSTSTIKSFIDQETMTPERFERGVMEELQTSNEGVHRIMLLYKEHEPELFNSIMEKASGAYKDGKGKDQLADIIRAEIAGYMGSKLKELSDEGILLYTDILARQLEQLGKEGQDAICMKMLREEPLGAVKWSKEMVELEYQLIRGVVMDGGGSGKVVDQQIVESAVNAAVIELMELHGQEKVSAVFAAISEAGATSEGACAVFTDYFRLLKKAAEPQAAPVLRTIFTSSS